jgi:hypothetical protein
MILVVSLDAIADLDSGPEVTRHRGQLRLLGVSGLDDQEHQEFDFHAADHGIAPPIGMRE